MVVDVISTQNDLGLSDPTLLPKASFINNACTSQTTQAPLKVFNPSNNRLLTTLPCASQTDIQSAIRTSTIAQKSWRQTNIPHRLSLLRKWVDLLRESRHDLARVITLENGKPYNQALGEVEYAAGFFDWNLQPSLHAAHTSTVDESYNSRTIITKSAIGVVLAITPWNFPLAMLARKVAPAVAAGCAIIAKPSELTPLAALMLAEIGKRAGMPAGLLNVVITDQAKEAVGAILDAESVQMMSFTGSTRVGKLVAERAAKRVLRTGLELGGHAPFIVFEDADIDQAINGLLKNKLRNSGQSCVCTNRVFVQNGAYKRFNEALAAKLRAMKVGDGFSDADVGPLIGSQSTEKIGKQIEDAKEKGAICEVGGKIEGNFCDVTLLTEVTDDMLIAQEETFGPVLGVLKFEKEAEVWMRANKTQAGLAAYVYTKDVGRIMTALRELEYGMIGLNDVTLSAAATSFGGLRESGLGREGGHDSLEDYLSTKFAILKF